MLVHTAAGGTRPRTPAAPQLARYSAELRCPIPDGTDALPDRGSPDVPSNEELAQRPNRPRNAIGAAKWASLIPFARAADLLKEVLPVGDLVNAETVRNHLQLTAERIEQELGEERQLNRFEGSEQEWERQPLPDGPITVGIDGGYVRAAHKQGWFFEALGEFIDAEPLVDRKDRSGWPGQRIWWWDGNIFSFQWTAICASLTSTLVSACHLAVSAVFCPP